MNSYFFLLLTFFLSFDITHYAKPRYDLTDKVDRFLLITGCARSGTKYIAKALTVGGLQIGHESLKKDGCASWFMNVQTDHAPYGRRSTENIHYQHIFHQVRHPLGTISSVYSTEPPDAFSFFSEYIPEINEELDSRLVKSAKYWYYWNLKAEVQAEWRYKLEEIDLAWEEMSAKLGVPLDKRALDIVPKTTNHRDKPINKFTWAELKKDLPPDLFSAIQDMTLRYGYSIND
ncbi:MAG: hypothetical protein WCG42_01735 [Parachlamydiaceae bacterium]